MSLDLNLRNINMILFDPMDLHNIITNLFRFPPICLRIVGVNTTQLVSLNIYNIILCYVMLCYVMLCYIMQWRRKVPKSGGGGGGHTDM